MYDVPRIVAPRIERNPDEASKDSVINFAAKLALHDKHFVPEHRDFLDLSLLSSREFALSYRHSQTNSKVQRIPHEDYSSKLLTDMARLDTFNSMLETDADRIIVEERQGENIVKLIMANPKLVDERHCAINSLRQLTNHTLDWGNPHIVIGKISPSVSPERFSSLANHILMFSDPDLGSLKFNNGHVKSSNIPLYDMAV